MVRYSLSLTPAVKAVLRAMLYLGTPTYLREVAAVTARNPGTVQPVLRRLLDHGWITPAEETTNRHRPRTPRLFYELTATGRRQAEALDLPPLEREYTDADLSPACQLRQLLHDAPDSISQETAIAALQGVLAESDELSHADADRLIGRLLAALTLPPPR